MSVRVVITDDSDIATAVISRVLSDGNEIHVIGRARTIQELMQLPARTAAHVIILDMLLPAQAGLSVVHTLAAEAAVVVVSEVGADSPMAAETIARGASAYISKSSLSTEAGARAFRQSVLDAASRRVVPGWTRVIGIAGSTGAIKAYETILPALRDAPVALLIIQHLPSDRVQAFADWLTSFGVPAVVASAGDALVPGRALVAPGGRHTTLDAHGRIRFVTSPPVRGHIPSASILFESAARLGPRVAMVVLSGMGDDGASAIPMALARGVTVFVQQPSESPVPSMPQATLSISTEVRALGVQDLSKALENFANHGR